MQTLVATTMAAMLLLVPMAKQAPKIDGALDDDAWKSAAVFEKFLMPGGKESKAKTKLSITQDDKALYIAVECFDDEKVIKTLVAEAKDHDDPSLWQDDDVELFMDPAGDGKTYYQIMINAKGVTGDTFVTAPDQKDPGWNPKYSSAVKVGKESWVAEFALPWSIFDHTPKIADSWKFNVLRSRQAYSELLYFSPIVGSAHQPEKFGKIGGIMGKAVTTSAPAAPVVKPTPAATKLAPKIKAGVDDLPELEVPKGND